MDEGNRQLETNEEHKLLLNVLHLLPLALKVLLPQADLVVTTADGEDVTAQTPAHAPEHAVKLECLASPLARVGCVGSPDADGLILRSRGDIGFGQDTRGPSDVTDPVGVALQGLGEVITLGLRAAAKEKVSTVRVTISGN